MSKQKIAAACWKYGKLYPNIFPNALKHAEDYYRQDRIERGVEENCLQDDKSEI